MMLTLKHILYQTNHVDIILFKWNLYQDKKNWVKESLILFSIVAFHAIWINGTNRKYTKWHRFINKNIILTLSI